MKTSLSKSFAFLFGISLLTSCAGVRLFYNGDGDPVRPSPGKTPDFTIYVIGDAGERNAQSVTLMKHVAGLALDDSQAGMVLFVGDNIYPAGMPPESDEKKYSEAVEVMRNQHDPLDSYTGEIIFIPGNHDWNEFKAGGLDAIKRQGNYLESLGDERISMQPEDGCGGPVLYDLNEKVVLIILDSQWWLHDWEKEPLMNTGCDVQSRDQLVREMGQWIRDHQDKQILITLHHPLFSQGAHGGHFTLRDHLFPLSKLVNWLYIPLPVIGSIYPYYRSVIGHRQDLKHRNYRAMKEAILGELKDMENVIFISGHDHNLQYIEKANGHFLISGSGAKQNPVANAKDLVFGHKAAGFMQLDFYREEGVYLRIYELDPDSGILMTVFSRFIIENNGP